MKKLRAFTKSEDAHLVASFLKSNEIEAVVIEDGGFGGNILGATKNAIRIEVPEEQFKEAESVLEQFETSEE